MSRAEPLITPEELQCLLGAAPASASAPTREWAGVTGFWQYLVHAGAALWLLKGLVLYAVLMSPEAANMVGSSLYIGLRGGLELVCLSAFWGAALHPQGRMVAAASMLVASTTLLMDTMVLLAFAG
jgi:hypothetical protein